jgi:hypothetical protein
VPGRISKYQERLLAVLRLIPQQARAELFYLAAVPVQRLDGRYNEAEMHRNVL